MAGDSSRGGHGGADQVGAATLALASLEVAVGGRRASLARLELVWVHAQTHRTAGLTPLGTSGAEDLVETLLGGLHAHPGRAGDDEEADAGGHRAASQHIGRQP